MASSSSETSKLATAKTVLSTMASVAATVVLVRSVLNDFMPHELQGAVCSGIRALFGRFSTTMTMVIDEFDGLTSNELYAAAETYLGAKVSPATQRLKVSKAEKEKSFVVTVDRGEEVIEVFNGAKVKWILVCREVQSKSGFYNPREMNSTLRSEVRSFELSFNSKHLNLVIDSYLPQIMKESMEAKQEKKTLKIFTVDGDNLYSLSDAWVPTNLDHPATFDTVALDDEVKSFVLKDLERFVKRRDYYRKVGKAWKRGYLLYGPPGTGKSSLIAAMANYLKFDVYDLELSELRSNSDLKRVLIGMANRSILVVEDIDCSIDFKDRDNDSDKEDSDFDDRGRSKLTLSGLLNFVDGLWSSCGDERIIIFTTNHKEKLDPALLRPGRMDVHLHLSFCSPCVFRHLAATYLGINDHSTFPDLERRILDTEVSPAEIAGELMKSGDGSNADGDEYGGGNADEALRCLGDFLTVKKKENEEAKVRKEREEKQKAEREKAKAEAKEKAKEKESIGDKQKETVKSE